MNVSLFIEKRVYAFQKDTFDPLHSNYFDRTYHPITFLVFPILTNTNLNNKQDIGMDACRRSEAIR